MFKLLSRTEFREAVFARDKHTCVACKKPAVDAHHVLERRLWPDGGYFLDNGVSVCEQCHLMCERTHISVEHLREWAGLKKILPPHLYDDLIYDKWGNVILPNGDRLAGDLFQDPSVKKVLGEGHYLSKFRPWVKYPRTYHLPFSPGVGKDDRVLNHEDMEVFRGKRVIVTQKMDGENSSLYHDYFHARSIDSRHHASRNWVKNLWSMIAHDIPRGWRICGENLYAKHSISYENLASYFMGFSIWTDTNRCLSWDETLEYFDLLRLLPVPVIYDGIYDWDKLISIAEGLNPETEEGFVLRLADDFRYEEFRKVVGKWVRPGHLSTVTHWFQGQRVERNLLSPDVASPKVLYYGD